MKGQNSDCRSRRLSQCPCYPPVGRGPPLFPDAEPSVCRCWGERRGHRVKARVARGGPGRDKTWLVCDFLSSPDRGARGRVGAGTSTFPARWPLLQTEVIDLGKVGRCLGRVSMHLLFQIGGGNPPGLL